MEYNEKETLYPSREGGRTAIIDSYMLPTDLRRIYDEVIKAMNNDQPVLVDGDRKARDSGDTRGLTAGGRVGDFGFSSVF